MIDTAPAEAAIGSHEDHLEALGRVALVTQGVLYGLMGVLAVRVAQGHRSEQPSQRGAIESLARGAFGRAALVVLAVGLLAHALWRILLAVRGEPGDDDGRSVAKRLANVGRAAVYASFFVLAVRILTDSGSGSGGGSGGGNSGGNSERKGAATVLDWPGGRALVIVVGLVVLGVAVWNASKAVTRKFVEHLDLAGRSERERRAVEILGAAGYGARGVAFGLVGWFLLQAGLADDATRAKGLDQALRRVADASHGPLLLGILAAGLVLFGAFRVLDGLLRRPADITWG